jgi:hypothetical protein
MATYVLAEFREEHALFDAARRLRELGHTDLDAHSPVPLHGVDEALGLKKSVVPLIALVGGILGAIGGYVMQYWMNAVSYAINVANRPPHSAPANIPITFECAILLSVLAIVFGLFALCGFPRLHHPAFDAPGFENHSVDGLWLSVRTDKGRAEAIAKELERLGAGNVSAVAEDLR